MTFLPKDLTPAQRAALKLVSHFVIIVVFNALLAAYVWIAEGSQFSWRAVALVAGAQAALALLDALKKYVSAQGDISFSTLIELARLQFSEKAPPISYPADIQAIKESVNTALENEIAPSPVVTPVK